MIGIYKIINPKNKVYIGQSVEIEKRFSAYKRLKCKGQRILYRSLKKYGAENHKFILIHECNVSELNELERHYQEEYNAIGSNGMNCRLTKTSDKSGYCSEETRMKIKMASVGTRVGRKHTQETKNKIGLANVGNNHGLGKKMSVDTKLKLKEINTGNKYGLGRVATEKQKNDHSVYMQGNKHCVNRIISEDTRNKISKATKGKKRTAETKKRLSLAKMKVILNTQTGVFFLGVKEASEAYNIKIYTLTSKLNGKSKNDTNLIYV